MIGLFTLLSDAGEAFELGDSGLVAAAGGQEQEQQEQEQEPADIILVRWYDSPEDERRQPLGMRPLVWRRKKERKKWRTSLSPKVMGPRAAAGGKCAV